MGVPLNPSPTETLKSDAEYIKGLADAFYMRENVDAARRLAEIAKWLEKASRNICGGGFFGCRGGPKCSSDHK